MAQYYHSASPCGSPPGGYDILEFPHPPTGDFLCWIHKVFLQLTYVCCVISFIVLYFLFIPTNDCFYYLSIPLWIQKSRFFLSPLGASIKHNPMISLGYQKVHFLFFNFNPSKKHRCTFGSRTAVFLFIFYSLSQELRKGSGSALWQSEPNHRVPVLHAAHHNPC